MKRAGIVPGLVAGIGLISLLLTGVAQAQARTETIGLTKASSDELKLAFSGPGVVQELLVKPGDEVKAGQVLMILEDYIDKKELERLRLAAESTARVEAAQADLEMRQSTLKRKQGAGTGAFSDAEIEEAQNDVTLREKQLKVAEEDRQEAGIRAEQQAHKVELLSLKSPVDGVVVKFMSHPGEWFDPQRGEGAVVVVNNDPLYVEVRDLYAHQVAMLKMGQKLKVRYPDTPDSPQNWQDAEVVYFSPVVDAASQTRLFKLKMANPQKRASGLEVIVKLPPEVAAAK